ncbi:unnamed protein product [marine sediment metagenome]|uniref:Hydroxylamine reductase n=1 Tax=marine sediment metagenome TaxID=412755 RepID=X1A9T0_9ZZZZ
MSMFCYQCQETAKGIGCTKRGVCGKSDDLANMQDLLVYLLKGISIFSVSARKLGNDYFILHLIGNPFSVSR